MSARKIVRAPLLALALFSAGCATAAARSPFAGPSQQGSGEIRILVQNRSVYQVRVYAVWGSKSQELGNVPGQSGAQLRMDLPDTGNLRFRIEPVAALQRTTNPVIVRPGDIVDLVVTPDPSNSFARVR